MACRSAASLTISTKGRCRPRCGSGRCSNLKKRRHFDMTNTRFGKRLVLAAWVAMLSMSASAAQQAEPAPKAGKLINVGDLLSGQLNAMRMRADKGKRATFQITSEPRRLPPPSGLCNLETGPETFQLVTSSDAQAGQLK